MLFLIQITEWKFENVKIIDNFMLFLIQITEWIYIDPFIKKNAKRIKQKLIKKIKNGFLRTMRKKMVKTASLSLCVVPRFIP